jgi:hypothetical protein
MYPVCGKEEVRCHILQCEGTRDWRDELLEKRLISIYPEIGIRK